MNRADTLRAGTQVDIDGYALKLAIEEVLHYNEVGRNIEEMAKHRSTVPICGKPGQGHKAWKRKYAALREESEEIYQNNLSHAIYNYESANNLTYYPSDLRDGRHHEVRRRAQDARREEMRRAREFVAANYTPEDDDA